MIKFIVVLFLIPYSDGDTEKVYTEHKFDTYLECQKFANSKEYAASLKIEYQGKGIINVLPACERRFIDVNYQKTGI